MGGFRIVFEYANRLSAIGHPVTLTYVAPPPHVARHSGLKASAWALASYLKTIVRVRRAPGGSWFDLDPSVQVNVTPRWRARNIGSDADVVVATAFPTAGIVDRATRLRGTAGMFLVQHLEDWFDGATERAVRDAWKRPLLKVAISRWLADAIREEGEGDRLRYVPNGIALDAYGVDRDPRRRDPLVLAMMTSSQPWKGHAWGMEAIEVARAKRPGLRVVLFGDGVAPDALPTWAEHRGSVDTRGVRSVMNAAAIFLHTSDSEGWGLPPAEAMACGTAIIVADNPGVLDYARDGQNAVVVPRRDVSAMADAIVALVDDQARRLALVDQARADIAAYSWERAVAGFGEAIDAALTMQKPAR